MASFKKQSVLNTNPELNNPELFHRDSRTMWMRIQSAVNVSFPLLIAACGIALFMFPQNGDFIFAFAICLKLTNSREKHEYPFDAPEWEQFISKKESLKDAVKAGHLIPQRKRGNGTLIFGFEFFLRRLLVSNPDMETRHTLVMGSTGSGKTVLILTLLFQALLQPGGTSAVIVDGKADIKLFWTIFAILKRLDRLHDLLVLNFLTPMDSLDTTNMHDDDRISNNMNILNAGTPDQMKTITMGLGRETDGGDSSFWEGRSSTMIGGAYQYLAYERDVEGLDLNIEVVRNFLVIKTMLKKAARKDVPLKYRQPLQQYLKTLPSISDAIFDMTEEQIDNLDLNSKADEQHTYCVMMISETMADLSETMGHIFVTKLSEVNMTDVCLGGRVLLVLLPSIAKNPDSVAALGRLLLQGLRPILMRAAGYKLQGSRITTVDNRPSSARYPVRLFFDEYGMYAVKGFYMIVALVRSYGFHVLFGAQTAGMFQKVCGRDEYEALMGNLNNKFILKNEDHGESLQLALGRTGKVFGSRQDRIENNLAGAVHDNDDVRVEEKDTVNAKMLASAEPGEGLYIFGGDVYPFRALKLDFPDVETSRLNYFAQVLEPSDDEVETAKRQQLVKSNEYVQQANDYIDSNVEMLEFLELKNNLTEVRALNLTENISKQMMMAIGLGIIKEDATLITESAIEEIEEIRPEESSVDVFDEELVGLAQTDAEVQIMGSMEAYNEEVSAFNDELDFNDFENTYSDEDWPEEEHDFDSIMQYNNFYAEGPFEHSTSEEVVSPPAYLSTQDLGTNKETSEVDLANFDNDAYGELDIAYNSRYVSSNLSDPFLESAQENNKGTISGTTIDINLLAGLDEPNAERATEAAINQVKDILEYPKEELQSEPLGDEEVSDIVEKTLQSLGLSE